MFQHAVRTFVGGARRPEPVPGRLACEMLVGAQWHMLLTVGQDDPGVIIERQCKSAFHLTVVNIQVRL